MIFVVKKQPPKMANNGSCSGMQRLRSQGQVHLDLFGLVIHWSRIFKMEVDSFLYVIFYMWYDEGVHESTGEAVRSESEHTGQSFLMGCWNEMCSDSY